MAHSVRIAGPLGYTSVLGCALTDLGSLLLARRCQEDQQGGRCPTYREPAVPGGSGCMAPPQTEALYRPPP